MTKKYRIRIRHGVLIIIAVLLVMFSGGYILAQIYKDEIVTKINQSVSEKISGELKIKDINFTIFNHFPSFSLSLEEPSLHDSLYNIHHQELFHAEKIILQIELSKLLRGEVNLRNVTIVNGSISIVKMKNGYSNTSIIRKNNKPNDSSATNNLSATINKMFLNNVHFSMVDSTKNKWFKIQFQEVEQTFDITSESAKIQLQGTINFGGLAFNAAKGSYLTDKTVIANLSLDLKIQEKKLLINSSYLELDKKKILIRGNFSFNRTPHMHLEIDAPSITVQQATSILTQSIASKLISFQFQNSLIAGVRIDGDLYPGSKPAVDVYFKTENNILNMKTQTFTEVNVLGWFLNHIDSTCINDDQNSKIILPRFQANMGGIPLKSKIMISNLTFPHLVMESTVDMALEDANGIVDTSMFTFNGGTLAIAFNYKGSLVDYIDTVNNRFLGEVNGKVNINNGNLMYVPKGFQFEKLNTNMTFNDSLLMIRELSLEINKNPVQVTGSILHFIPFLLVPDRSLFADLIVTAGNIDFDNFNNTPAPKAAKNKSKVKKKTPGKKINATINNLINGIEADILLNATKINSGKFTATNLTGHIILDDDFVRFKEVKMNTSGGNFGLSGSVTSLQRAPFQLSITTSVVNADISNLFYSFNNFNQKTITNQNIKGKLTANVIFNTQLKKDYAVIPKTMKGRIIFQIQKGALVKMEGMEVLSKYAFKNRDFSNIEFAQLKDTITLEGQLLHMSRLQIQSSVVTLFAEGTYGFAGGTDLSIQIPLNNLKKQDDNYIPVNVSADTKLGPSVFLRAQNDKEGKLQIQYDPLKNYYKDNNISTESKLTKKEMKKEKKQK